MAKKYAPSGYYIVNLGTVVNQQTIFDGNDLDNPNADPDAKLLYQIIRGIVPQKPLLLTVNGISAFVPYSIGGSAKLVFFDLDDSGHMSNLYQVVITFEDPDLVAYLTEM